jgi:hypothetical protein
MKKVAFFLMLTSFMSCKTKEFKYELLVNLPDGSDQYFYYLAVEHFEKLSISQLDSFVCDYVLKSDTLLAGIIFVERSETMNTAYIKQNPWVFTRDIHANIIYCTYRIIEGPKGHSLLYQDKAGVDYNLEKFPEKANINRKLLPCADAIQAKYDSGGYFYFPDRQTLTTHE